MGGHLLEGGQEDTSKDADPGPRPPPHCPRGPPGECQGHSRWSLTPRLLCGEARLRYLNIPRDAGEEG